MNSKLKKWILLGVIIMDISTITACTNQRADYLKTALNEKYHIDVNVKQITNSYIGSSGACYTAYCTLKDNNELLFKVDVLGEEKIIDGYEEALIGAEVKKKIDDVISSTVKNYRTLTKVKNGADGFNVDTEISGFIEKNKTSMDLMIIVDTDTASNIEPDYIYTAAIEICKKIGKYNGSFNLYYVDSDTMKEVNKLVNENPNASSVLLRECGKGFNTLVENGVMKKTKDDMIKALY